MPGANIQSFTTTPNSSLYNPGAYSQGGFTPGSNLTNNASGVSFNNSVPIGSFLGGGSSGGGFGGGGGSTSAGAQRVGNYTFYHPDRPLNWTNYGPEGPSWALIRNNSPQTIMGKGRGSTGGQGTVAPPAGDSQVPSAFNGQGYDSTSAFINDLVAQIAGGGGTPTTTGWFDLPQRPLNLFGSSY